MSIVVEELPLLLLDGVVSSRELPVVVVEVVVVVVGAEPLDATPEDWVVLPPVSSLSGKFGKLAVPLDCCTVP